MTRTTRDIRTTKAFRQCTMPTCAQSHRQNIPSLRYQVQVSLALHRNPAYIDPCQYAIPHVSDASGIVLKDRYFVVQIVPIASVAEAD